MIDNLVIGVVYQNKELLDVVLSRFTSISNFILIDGSKGLYGLEAYLDMIEIASNRKYEWLVVVDEDAFVYNEKDLLDLILFLKNNNYHVAGVQDGGLVNHRVNNPYSFNFFFTIFDLNFIREVWTKKSIIRANQKILKEKEFGCFSRFENVSFNTQSLFEPYYCIFLYLRRKGASFFHFHVEEYCKDDNLSTVVFSHDLKKIVVHTWMSRFYKSDTVQKIRIDKMIEELPKSNLSFETTKGNIIAVQDTKSKFRKIKYYLDLFIRKLGFFSPQ